MSNQGELFQTGPRQSIAVRDRRHVPPAERPRLSQQSLAILERLRQGPATNYELAAIALRFGARLHDLRGAGYRIDILEHDHQTGRVLYGLGGAPR